jgi:hypothetical protein
LGVALSAWACGGVTGIPTPATKRSGNVGPAASSTQSSSSGAGGEGGGSGAGGTSADAGRPIAPTPNCTGEGSDCIYVNAIPVGAAEITCEGVYFVGAWNLILQRQVNGNFVTVQTQVVQEPGFGANFYDTSGPPVEVTYRVCVVDGYGTRCGAPFMNLGPVDCKCIPLTCETQLTCDYVMDDGCGSKLTCTGCTNGITCNAATHSCCAPGFESAGSAGCLCAPDRICGPGTTWDFQMCACGNPG